MRKTLLKTIQIQEKKLENAVTKALTHNQNALQAKTAKVWRLQSQQNKFLEFAVAYVNNKEVVRYKFAAGGFTPEQKSKNPCKPRINRSFAVS
ncbi:MAG: hypothetical protein MZV70_01550 [Desulfobacterales bacterium]|nr:hypothetical protein [Desulfobacterales bacterium]